MNSYRCSIASWLYRIFLSSIIILSVIANGYTQSSVITDYQVYFGITKKDNKDLIIIRKFMKDKKEYFFLVNPFNLDTEVIETKECESIKLGFNDIKSKFYESVYFRALDEARENVRSMQDEGITHALPQETGINLTIDLCPSEHPLDRKLFMTLINAYQNIEHPIPLAIAISGHWINRHPQDLIWLKELQSKGEIYITWINHTLSHHFNKKLPLQNNFMLMKTTDVRNEILGNEILMIKNGLKPSVFFRFPGLISNDKLLDTVSSYGLITVGSDAWLAKGESAHRGSIVLIHGNGNEPIGVARFIKLINSKKAEERNRSWLLFDLRKSIDEEFDQTEF